MGHWANDKALHDLRRIRERHIDAGRKLLRVAVLRGAGVEEPAALDVIEHVHRRRGVSELVVAGDNTAWWRLSAWCWGAGIRLTYRPIAVVVRMRVDGAIALGHLEGIEARFAQIGVKVWRPSLIAARPA